MKESSKKPYVKLPKPTVKKTRTAKKPLKKTHIRKPNGGDNALPIKYSDQYQRIDLSRRPTFSWRFIDLIYGKSSMILPTSNSCFTNGTFMFEDNDRKLFNNLKKSKFSHTWYKTTHKMLKKKPGFVCSTHHLKNECKTDDIHQYEIEIPEKMVTCGSDKVIKRVILMYNVKIQHGGVSKFFTFFKLESWPAISANHTAQAFKRYLLKKESTKTVSMKRREDCQKDKNGCLLYSKFTNASYQDDHIKLLLSSTSKLNQTDKKDIYESITWYNNFVRTGDELFVPQYLTNKLMQI